MYSACYLPSRSSTPPAFRGLPFSFRRSDSTWLVLWQRQRWSRRLSRLSTHNALGGRLFAHQRPTHAVRFRYRCLTHIGEKQREAIRHVKHPRTETSPFLLSSACRVALWVTLHTYEYSGGGRQGQDCWPQSSDPYPEARKLLHRQRPHRADEYNEVTPLLYGSRKVSSAPPQSLRIRASRDISDERTVEL